MTSAIVPERLGELDLPKSFDAFYLLGTQIARLNAAGLLLRPGFRSDLSLSASSGWWTFASTHYVEKQVFAPERSVGQFVDFAEGPLAAVLGGYARQAAILLDPTYPGFAASVLEQGLPTLSVAATLPRPVAFDLARVLRAYGASLRGGSKEPKLTWVAPASPAAVITDTELLLVATVVFIAELDPTAWLTHVAACEPQRELAQVLAALAHGELRASNWGGLLPQLLGSHRMQRRWKERLVALDVAAHPLLRLFSTIYDQPERLSTIYAQGAPIRYLRAALDAEPTAKPGELGVRGPVLAGIMDGLSDLALLADLQGETGASIRFAQWSCIVLQVLPCPAEPAAAEAWLTRLEAQEYRYSWSRPRADQFQDATLTNTYAGYAGSVSWTSRLCCETVGEWVMQGRVRNQWWTCAWQALERLRTALQLWHASHHPDTVVNVSVQALQYLLAHYCKTLTTLAAMLSYNPDPERELSQWVQSALEQEKEEEYFPMVELSQGTTLHALLEHGYGAAAHQALTALVAAMPGPGTVALPADAPAETDELVYHQEENAVFQAVLGPLLRQAFWRNQLQNNAFGDAAPILPRPDAGEEWDQLEAQWNAHADRLPQVMVLNFAPWLRALPVQARENGGLLLGATLGSARYETLQALASRPQFGTLRTRPHALGLDLDLWRYTPYFRYEVFQQYPNPVGSEGYQTGLQLSRVCFNAARDIGCFSYNLDYHTYALGDVALVRKRQGCWTLAQE
jgi:hypothetical protein